MAAIVTRATYLQLHGRICPGADQLSRTPGSVLHVLAVMMVPGQVILVPMYMLLSELDWINTYAGLTVPFLTQGFGIFLMRQFFLSIPGIWRRPASWTA